MFSLLVTVVSSSVDRFIHPGFVIYCMSAGVLSPPPCKESKWTFLRVSRVDVTVKMENPQMSLWNYITNIKSLAQHLFLQMNLGVVLLQLSFIFKDSPY